MTMMTKSDFIITTFAAIYGNAASSYSLTGDPEGDEELVMTLWFPNQPDRVFRHEPCSDDDGIYRFRLDNSTVTITVPYP